MVFGNQNTGLFQKDRRSFETGAAGLALQLAVTDQNPIQRIEAGVHHQNAMLVRDAVFFWAIIDQIHIIQQAANRLRHNHHILHIHRPLCGDFVLTSESLAQIFAQRFILELRNWQSSHQQVNFLLTSQQQACMKQCFV